MKKARLLSLLLAAVMTASSLPIVANAAEPAAENHIASGVMTASGAITAHDADQSGYLSVGNRWKGEAGNLDGRSQSLVYAYNFKYGTKYRITFDARLGVPASSAYSFRLQSSGHGNEDYHQRSRAAYASVVTGQDIILPSGSFHWFNLPTNPGAFEEVNTKWKTDYPAGSQKPSEAIYKTYEVKTVDGVSYSDNVPVGYLNDVSDPSWKTFSFEYEYAAKPATATADTVLGYVGFYGGKGSSYSQAFDMDNFVLEEYKDGAWVEIESYDFNTEVPMGGDAGTFTKGYGWTPNHANAIHSIVLVEDGDTAYNRVAATDGVDTEITYSFTDTVLAPGVYTVSADLRYAYSTCIGDPKDRCNVAMSLDGDELATALVPNAWTTLSNTIAVYEATAISELVFAADASAPLDIKDVEIALVSPFSETVVSDDLLNGATVNYSGVNTKVATPAEANGYLSIGPRAWTGTTSPMGVVNIDIDAEIEVGTTYYVSCDVRSSVVTEPRPTSAGKSSGDGRMAIRTLTNSNNSEENRAYAVPTSDSKIVGSTTSTIIPNDTSWRNYKVSLTPTNCAGEDIKLKIWRGTGDQTGPLDIDNYEVYYFDETGAKVTLFATDFDDPTEAVIGVSGELNKFYKTDSELKHVIDDAYNTHETLEGKEADISYDLSALNIGGGIYELTASVRVPKYVYIYEQGAYVINNRNAALTYTLSDGTTDTVEAAFDVIWNTLSTPIIVKDGVTVESIVLDTDVDSEFLLDYSVSLKQAEFSDLAIGDEASVAAEVSTTEEDIVLTYDVSDYALTAGVFSIYAAGGVAGERNAEITVNYADGKNDSSDVAFALPTDAPVSLFTVNEGSYIDEIVLAVPFDGFTGLDYALQLICEDFDVVVTEDSKNHLDGSAVQPTNAVIEDIEVKDPDGYLFVGAREASTSTNFLTIDLGAKSKANTTYYMSFDVKTADGGKMHIRPSVNVTTLESIPVADGGRFVEGMYTDLGMNGKYLVPSEGTTANVAWGNTSKDADDNPNGQNYPYYEFFGNEVQIVGEFTPKDDNQAMSVIFTRGTSSAYIQPLDIDNIKVWYMDGEKEVVVYDNNFDFEGADAGITTRAKELTHVLPTTHTAVTPVNTNEEVRLAYDLSLSDSELVDGAYVFAAKMRTTDKLEAAVPVQIVYTYENGDVRVIEASLTDVWSTVAFSKTIDKTNPIAKVEIVLPEAVAIMIKDATLVIEPTQCDGFPSIGMVMLLLYKKAGGIRTVVKEEEFIENGDLEKEPVINNEAYPKVQTTAEAGFWAKDTAARTTNLEYVTEDGNSFVRVKDLVNSQRGVWFNTGVELQPGTYTFTVDLRVSEQADAAHYTEYKWRSEAKDHMNMRTMLQNSNGVGSGNYAPFEPVDLDTQMNNNGQVVGVSTKITREWTTYTDTITVDKPTVAIFKIGGGTGGDPDSHGFDIDNLSIVGLKTYYYKNGVPVDSLDEIPAEEEATESGDPAESTPDVEGNLIVNGDFDAEPTIVAGETYDETKANAWFQNDGEQFDTDAQGKALEEQGKIPFNHKITWTDGYLTFSGRENNLRNFWYNAGVTAEPGNYKLTLDFKTANEGETSSVRVGVAGLFSPTATDALTIDNEWKTMTINFTVTEATAIRLNFWGGPGAAYTHDFCVDNVVLEKLA